jgi:uncharacterized protein YdeI (YjbR/CyaY-like superfamily)
MESDATTRADLPVVSFTSVEAFAAWLEAEHASSPGIWLKIAKKASGTATVTYDQALDVAICYGWIDGQKGALDADWWLQRFTPRKARSRWSQVNRKRAEALIAAGAMRPAGLAQVEAARADGRWAEAYPSARDAGVPPDLQAALDAAPDARAFFETLDSRNRYAVLYRIGDAKKPQTRAARIQKYVAMLAAGDKLYP